MELRFIDGYVPYGFQVESIRNGINAVNRYGGCCIFDETGLGKTITGSHIAINLVNGGGDIMVISPRVNQGAWSRVLPGAKICTRQKIAIGSYDTVIIDEAHHFNKLGNKSYMDLISVIYFSGRIPKVILLTATPLNNDVSEFGNMLRLIPFPCDSLPFYALGLALLNAVKLEADIRGHDRHEARGGVVESRSYYDRAKYRESLRVLGGVLRVFCFRNTRVGISERYSDDIELMGHFPKVIRNDINVNLSIGFGIIKVLDDVKFALYNPTNYAGGHSNGFNGVMRTLLMKRLDSSVSAFRVTLGNIIQSHYDVIGVGVVYDADGNVINVTHNFWDDCHNDLEILVGLMESVKDMNDDAKLGQLGNLISSIDGKIIVFTEYVETQRIIVDYLSNKFSVLEYNGSTDDKVLDVIASEFDRNMDKNGNKYKVLVATDALSEGVNLHLAESLIHYDLKWNPSRLIQREGRVNRLVKSGVKPNDINVHYFGVDALIETIVKLERKLVHKSVMSDLILNSDYQLMVCKSNIPPGYVENASYDAIKTSDGFLVINNSANIVCDPFVVNISDYPNHGRFFRFGSTKKAKAFSVLRFSNLDQILQVESDDERLKSMIIFENPLYYSILMTQISPPNIATLKSLLQSWPGSPPLVLGMHKYYGVISNGTVDVLLDPATEALGA